MLEPVLANMLLVGCLLVNGFSASQLRIVLPLPAHAGPGVQLAAGARRQKGWSAAEQDLRCESHSAKTARRLQDALVIES